MPRLAALLATALLSSCSKPDQSRPAPAQVGPKELKEVEPNDSLERGTSIAEPVRIQAQLAVDAQRLDEDYSRIEALGPTKVARFEVSGVPGADIVLELLDRDGNHVATYDSEPEGVGEQIAQLNLGAPAVVKVSATKKGVGGAYTAQVSIADA